MHSSRGGRAGTQARTSAIAEPGSVLTDPLRPEQTRLRQDPGAAAQFLSQCGTLGTAVVPGESAKEHEATAAAEEAGPAHLEGQSRMKRLLVVIVSLSSFTWVVALINFIYYSCWARRLFTAHRGHAELPRVPSSSFTYCLLRRGDLLIFSLLPS